MQQKAHWNSTASRVQEAILATATGLPNKDGDDDDDDDDDDAADDDPDPDGGCGTRVVVAVAGVTIVVGVSELLLASTAAETAATSSRSAPRLISFWLQGPIYTQGITRPSTHATFTIAATSSCFVSNLNLSVPQT